MVSIGGDRGWAGDCILLCSGCATNSPGVTYNPENSWHESVYSCNDGPIVRP